MHIVYDWPQNTAMTLVMQGQGHSAYNRVILLTHLIINTLFIMMFSGLNLFVNDSHQMKHNRDFSYLQRQGLSYNDQRDFFFYQFNVHVATKDTRNQKYPRVLQ